MTSNQSLQSKLPSKKDFQVSLCSVIVPAVINLILSLIVFVFMPVNYFLTFDSITELRKNVSICLTENMAGYGYSITFNFNLGIIFVVIGMLFSLLSFRFKMKKKTVNVYYSLAVDRKTMFRNRVFASLICIALSLLVPIIIDTIINIHFLGNAGYIAGSAFLLFAESFVYELAGFVIMSVAMAVCHTIIESVVFGAGLVTLPTIILSTVNAVALNFLRGFDGTSFIYAYNSGLFSSPDLVQRFSFLNPLYLGKNINPDRYIEDNIINFVHRDFRDSEFWIDGTVSQADYLNEKIGFDYILPVIIWIAISTVFLVVARQLFIKSKAENAGLHASVPIINELFAAEVGLILMDLWFNGLYEGHFSSIIENGNLCMLIGVLLFAVAYFIILIISKRTFRIRLRSLACAGTGVAVSVVLFIVISTGALGYSSYVPQASQVKWATVAYGDIDTTASENLNQYAYSFDVFSSETLSLPIGCFRDAEDIQAVIDINETAVRENDDDMSNIGVYFRYELTNGKTVCRYYDTTDRSLEKQLLSLRDSNALKEELTYLLSNQDKNDAPITNFLQDSNVDITEFFNGDYEQSVKKSFETGTVSVLNRDNNYTYDRIKNTPEFREALLKDLLSQNYEQRFMPKEKAIGMVEFSEFYEEITYDETVDEVYTSPLDYSASGIFGYYIYESMTNTVDYLKSTGEYKYFASKEDAEIESVSIEKCSNIFDAQLKREWNSSSSFKRLFNSSVEYDEDYEFFEDYEYYSITSYFTDSLKITDKEQIKELIDNAQYFGFAENDDYVICVTYKNGVHKTMLILNQNAPDFIK